MITYFNNKDKKVYQLFPRAEWRKLLLSGECRAYDIKWDKFYGVEIMDESSPKAIARRDKVLKKRGVVPYSSLTDFIENEEVSIRESERIKIHKKRLKNKRRRK